MLLLFLRKYRIEVFLNNTKVTFIVFNIALMILLTTLVINYNSQYKTTIYAQGNVGDIKFYTDVFIQEPLLAIYVGPEHEEFIINVDFELIKEKGIDFYLGHILKKVEEEHEERIKANTEKKVEPKPTGNSEMVTFNPGAVRYEDLKAYLEIQNAQRYKQ